MTATVISLDAKRLSREPACGCPRHRLEALTARAVAELAGTEEALLVPRDVVERLVDDLVATIGTALAYAGEESQ